MRNDHAYRLLGNLLALNPEDYEKTISLARATTDIPDTLLDTLEDAFIKKEAPFTQYTLRAIRDSLRLQGESQAANLLTLGLVRYS